MVLATFRSLAWNNIPVSTETGIPTDLAISGPGYFVVRDPSANDGSLMITRYGDFTIDANGYLVSLTGQRVQGYTDISLAQIGDLKIDATGLPAGTVLTGYHFQSDGKIVFNLNDGEQVVREQVLLQNVAAPANLTRLPYGMRGLTPSSQPLPNPVPPGTGGLGMLLVGQIEPSVPFLSLSRIQSPLIASAQGTLTGTGIPTDMAIQGSGFFIVRDTNSNQIYPTRAGAFYLDGDGHLNNYAGMRVQGYSDTNLNSVGDIEVNTNGIVMLDPEVIMLGYHIDWSGKIFIFLSDGSTFVRGQILLENCGHPELLVKTNFGVYTSVAAAGPWTPPTIPQTAGLGAVLSGTVELSKFDDAILEYRKHLNFFFQGPISSTTNVTDLAISGTGFFTVRDPAQNVFYATRKGAFHLDVSGHLMDANGFRVQGLTDSTGNTVGDLVIDAAAAFGNSNATMSDFHIEPQGTIEVELSNGNTFVRGQVLLQNFRDLQALKPETNQLYSNLSAAMPLYPIGIPASQELGLIFSSALEDIYSQPTLQLPLQTGFRLYVSDLATEATVEASTNLVSWAPVGQVTGSIMQDAEFYDTNAPAMDRRYYRLRFSGF